MEKQVWCGPSGLKLHDEELDSCDFGDTDEQDWELLWPVLLSQEDESVGMLFLTEEQLNDLWNAYTTPVRREERRAA